MAGIRPQNKSRQDGELEILYQDEDLIAIDKPSGLLVHRSPIDRHETRFAIQLLRDQLGQWVYPLHRLDKPTSGILLFALSPEMAREMGPVFETGRVAKRYLALVRGYTADQGHIDHALKEKLDRLGDADADPDKPAQTAVSDYRRLARVELPHAIPPHPTARYSLVEVMPRTGRKHQVRRHMKHIAHPIVGDTTHGKSVHNRLFEREYGCKRQLLAAIGLSFEHPRLGRRIDIEHWPGGCFGQLIESLDWDWDEPLPKPPCPV